MNRLILALGLAAFALCLGGCATSPASRPLAWRQLPPLPDREGFAGAYAGVSAGCLLVAGGANFPDQKPWEGGRKVWHDTVFVLESPAGAWRVAGKLPRPLGYGVSITAGARMICIGGSDAERHYPDCFVLAWENGRLTARPLPPLPLPLANAAGAAIGEVIYVCGGSEAPGERAALNRLFALDLRAHRPAWRELEPCPGQPRLLPVAAAVDGAFYLVGGAVIVAHEGQPAREYLRDAWRYQPGRGWRQVADLPKPIVAAPSPAPARDATFFIVGGDDGSLVGFQPVSEHPGFPGRMLAYDIRRNEWRDAGEAPAPRATLPVAFWQGRFVLPSGEVRPGIRSPEVWVLQVGGQR